MKSPPQRPHSQPWIENSEIHAVIVSSPRPQRRTEGFTKCRKCASRPRSRVRDCALLNPLPSGHSISRSPQPVALMRASDAFSPGVRAQMLDSHLREVANMSAIKQVNDLPETAQSHDEQTAEFFVVYQSQYRTDIINSDADA